MGRGANNPGRAGAPAPRGGASDEIRAWIESVDDSAHPLPDLDRLGPSLLAEYDEAPGEGDPLVRLPDDIEEREPGEQLYELTRTFGGDVHYSLGLALLATGTAQSDGERRLALSAQRLVQRALRETDAEDEDEAMDHLLAIFRERERELHWACRKLGWPSDWVLEAVRSSVLRYAERGGYLDEGKPSLPGPDLEYEATLDELHGPVPEGLDPLCDLPEGIEKADRAEQMAALESAYGGLARAMVAQDEMAAGHFDGEFAREVQEQLAREAERAGEQDDAAALYRWLRLRQAEEAHLHWAARALDLPTSSVVAYLKQRIAKS